MSSKARDSEKSVNIISYDMQEDMKLRAVEFILQEIKKSSDKELIPSILA